MPASFPEVWLNRVRMLFTTQDVAPWLNGVEELNTTVLEMGSGTASEINVIHVPTSDFKPEVLLNNSTYPIALQSYTDDEVIIQLDKYQTKVTTLSDDEINGAAYPKIDAATKPHIVQINAKKYGKAIHAIAPTSDSADTPVIQATGATVGSRNRLTYEDLVNAKSKLDLMDCEDNGRRIVLCSDHWNDLLLDRQRFGNLLVDYQLGKPAPIIAGFEIYQYIQNPLFTSAGVKKAFGAVPASGDRKASVFFLVSNITQKTGAVKQYFTPAVINPRTQANELNYRHYYIATPVRPKYIGAIY